MVHPNPLLAIILYTSLTTALPLTPQLVTAWQENSNAQPHLNPVIVPVQHPAPIKLTIPISRIELSRIPGSRAKSIIIIPNDSNQNTISPTITSPSNHRQQSNVISTPRTLSEQIDSYTSSPITLPPRIPSPPHTNPYSNPSPSPPHSKPQPQPKESTACEKATKEAKRKVFVAKTKMLVRIGKGRVIWAVLQDGKWVGVEGVRKSSLEVFKKEEGVLGLERRRGRDGEL